MLKPFTALVVIAFLLPGCRTDPRPSAALSASVELHDNTPGQIGQVATQVFREHGFRLAHKTYSELVFEKQASRMDNLAYGSWMDDAPVWLRVKAEIVPEPNLRWRLQCRALLVRDPHEAMEEELRVKLRRGPFEKLLEEVAQRLGNPTAVR